MPQAAEAHDWWADQPDPTPQRRRREAISWASADDLEVLGGIGKTASADWTVLTLERDDARAPADAPAFDDGPELESTEELEPRGPRIGARPSLSVVEDERAAVELRASRGRADHEGDELAASIEADDQWAESGEAHGRPTKPSEPGGRRTVVIRGRVAERQRGLVATNQRRRPARRASERVAHRPDRVAMWAVGLGLLLILVALLSAGGS